MNNSPMSPAGSSATVQVPVSVIVPCYNNAGFLAECVKSINALHPPDEIIIIDDRSTDESLAVAKGLAAIHSNITIVERSRNGGAAAARLDGINAARHQWIALVDADDFVEQGAVCDAWRRVSDDQADICIWDMWRYRDGASWVAIPLDSDDFPKTGREAVIDTLGEWRIHPLGVARKEIYVAAYGRFTGSQLNADELLTRLVFSSVEKIVFSRKKYFYRVNPHSSTQQYSPRQLSTLQSDIWLLLFAKDYPEVTTGKIGKSAIAKAWGFHRNRERLGRTQVQKAITAFLCQFKGSEGSPKWLWRSPKHLFAYFLLCILYPSKPHDG